MDDERGFTLIELLVVLAIIGILVGITALSLGSLVTGATTTSMQSERDQVRAAIDVYTTQKALGADCCTEDISAQDTLVQVTTDGTFGQFLRRTTKYYYTWTDDGASVSVCEDGTGANCLHE